MYPKKRIRSGKKNRFNSMEKIKRAIKKAITALTILAIIAGAGYFLYPILQSGEIQSSFQSVGGDISGWWNESSGFRSNVSEEYIPYSKASGSRVCLINYKNATDPTWDELISFLESDDTDEQPYIEDSFVCADFAEMLHNNAEKSGIKAAWVGVDFELTSYPLPTLYPFYNAADNKKPGYGISIPGEGHALNAFNTTDKGLVYVDCTKGFSSPIIAELTGSEERGQCEHDKIAYVIEGKEYGLVSIDKATSPKYSFYEVYTEKWEDLEKDIEAYNKDVGVSNKDVKAYERDAEAYEKAVGGRTYISDPEEYARLNKMYNALKAKEGELDIRGDELDAWRERLNERQAELGYCPWESLGVVTNVEVYW